MRLLIIYLKCASKSTYGNLAAFQKNLYLIKYLMKTSLCKKCSFTKTTEIYVKLIYRIAKFYNKKFPRKNAQKARKLFFNLVFIELNLIFIQYKRPLF